MTFLCSVIPCSLKTLPVMKVTSAVAVKQRNRNLKSFINFLVSKLLDGVMPIFGNQFVFALILENSLQNEMISNDVLETLLICTLRKRSALEFQC